MPLGTIKKLTDNGFGFIAQESGRDLFFHMSSLSGSEFGELREGMVVEFKVGVGPKGPRAEDVRVVKVGDAEREETSAEQSPSQSPNAMVRKKYRFHNPYNFVRFLDEPNSECRTTDNRSFHLLTRCAAPPHDRFCGLSGRITCRLSTVTPLFVSDAHEVDLDEETGHKTYRFFELNGEKAIPASTLRGECRSIFEAATNSCLPAISDSQLDYRIPASIAKHVRAAVVTALPDLVKEENGRVQLLSSAWLHQSLLVNASSVLATEMTAAPLPQNKEPFNKYFHSVLRQHTTPVQARIRQKTNRRSRTFFKDKSHSYPFDEVQEITSVGKTGDALGRPDGDLFWGFVKITGPNVLLETGDGPPDVKKHDERFFYYDGGEPEFAEIPWRDVPQRENAAERYAGVRKAQHKGTQLRYVTYLPNETLTTGDLVWVALRSGGKTVAQIGSVAVPKFRYQHALSDLLPCHLRACDKVTSLCRHAARSVG